MRYITLTLLLFSSIFLSAQTFKSGEPLLPLNPGRSVIFGKDIVIHDQPDQNERTVAICSAYNGWLYAAYSYDSISALWLSFWKSTDNGIHWENILVGLVESGNCALKKFDIAVCGNSETNLKLFFAGVVVLNNLNFGQGFVWRYNAITLEYEKTLLYSMGIRDVSFSSDFIFPAANANPYSVGFVYSKYEYPDNECLIYFSSGNGGESITEQDTLGISHKPYLKASLTYGRSPSWSGGRYYAVWEQADNVNSPTGHIYTAHTEPNFDSHFTKPVCIDSLDPSAINLCRNPVIACQYNDTDNDSANLTTVILYEQYDPLNDRFDVKGVYNLQSTLTSYFKPISFTNPVHENIQPDIAFNPFTSEFMATWYNATDQKLPFVTNNQNFQQPNDWTIVSAGYNDAPDLEDPHPKVRLDLSEQKGINAWRSEGTGGNGVALFDAEYSTWTGVSENNKTDGARLLKAYPNPCSSDVTICFELQKAEKVSVSLYNMIGQPEGIITDQYYSSGKHFVNYPVSNLPPGSYYYTFKAGEFSGYGKFCVVNY